MSTARLSTKGQIVIPKPVRELLGWHAGQEVEMVASADGLVLRATRVQKPSRLADVAGCLIVREGPPIDISEHDRSIDDHVRNEWRDGADT